MTSSLIIALEWINKGYELGEFYTKAGAKIFFIKNRKICKT